jgi:hypothetical protein
MSHAGQVRLFAIASLFDARGKRTISVEKQSPPIVFQTAFSVGVLANAGCPVSI